VKKQIHLQNIIGLVIYSSTYIYLPAGLVLTMDSWPYHHPPGYWYWVQDWFLAGMEHVLLLYTSLNPVPNAQVCVYLTVHITKLQLQTTFSKPLYIPHFACIHGDPGCWKSCWVCCWYWYQNLGGAPPWGRACIS
jgi:hypothetical protein